MRSFLGAGREMSVRPKEQEVHVIEGGSRGSKDCEEEEMPEELEGFKDER